MVQQAELLDVLPEEWEEVRPSLLRRLWVDYQHRLLGIGFALVFLLGWQYVGSGGFVDPLFTSSPSRVVATAVSQFSQGEIWNDLYVTLAEFAWGLGLAIVTGIPFGLALGWYRSVNSTFGGFISAMLATPRVALIPLFIIWLGIGPGSKVAMAFLAALFPVLINTSAGVKSIDRDLLNMARSVGASDRKMFLTVALPSSVPFILSGLRLAVGQALVGVVVGELYVASAGIGYIIGVAGQTFQTDKVFMGVIIVAAAGVLMSSTVGLLERHFSRWRPSGQ